MIRWAGSLLFPLPPDLDCKDIPYRNFRVLPPDPLSLRRGRQWIGCEA